MILDFDLASFCIGGIVGAVLLLVMIAALSRANDGYRT